MQDKQEQYIAPQLTLIGQASEVVRGMTDLGLDMRGESLIRHFEFESDQPPDS